jgi:L-fuculose-phosphate aldolase
LNRKGLTFPLMNIPEARNEIVKYGALLYRNGFIAGYDGNLSVRTAPGRIIITPTLTAKGFLKPRDLIVIGSEGDKISGKGEPSSETAMHLAIYKNRPGIEACCHAHPPFATAMAAAGKKIAGDILPEAAIFLGKVPLVEYIPTGLPEKWKAFSRYIKGHFAFLLRNHGVLTIGKTLEEAYFRMETVEHYARIIYIGQNIGRLNKLDKTELARLDKIHKKLFGES